MVNFLLVVLIALIFVFLLFLAIIALCVAVIVRDNRREQKKKTVASEMPKTKLSPDEQAKVKQFENLMKFDGTKQPPIRKENE
ncbi:hypothetical protein [Holdemania massiliensis]|uniref:hypothetical protein n=1 Tax=Holdemania massiliensis TaxID=1468449 RepID=UPI00267566ED|nr:hypothetical protein [Holdemania massiliensis]